jgi:LysM repeat protein
MKYGAKQIPAEADLAKRTQDAADGLVCLDMEVEWNGQVGAAETLAALIGGHGTLLVSTWADPAQQNWLGVIQALDGVTDIWAPQQYNNWLDAQEGQLLGMKGTIQPTFDLSQEFGANDPLGHARTAMARGQRSISLWELGFAQKDPALVRAIAAVMDAPATPPPAPPSPMAYTYTVQSGDTLSGIAQRLGLNWFHDLYLPNQAVIEAVARAHGEPNSENGNLIYPGTLLTYQK